MDRKLEQTLTNLRNEVSRLPEQDLESKQKLELLIQTLERKLGSPDDLDYHNSLTKTVSDTVSHFEVSHPRITGILNDVMMTLSNMGI